MDRFEFFFSFHLGERLYSYTDNLSKSLQGSKMAAVSGQRLANLTKETLTKMRINQSFDLSMLMLPARVQAWLATLPRKRRTPAGLEVGARAPSYSQTAKDHFRRSIMRLLVLLSMLSISALTRKASAAKPKYRPSLLELLMMTTMRQSSSFLKHHAAKMGILRHYLGN